jgi:hypothetical protein
MKPKIHYAYSGEWGGTYVQCRRYFITDVLHTGDKNKVTCKKCLKRIKPTER